jgi:pyruvate formate lyase activating enzyme
MSVGDTAIVFDVQRFAVHDGPGIRTLVFFKGCPLRCIWCSNPESHVVDPQLVFFPGRCIRCLKCVEACTKAAVSVGGDNLPMTDRALCDDCGECTETCYADARVILGRRVGLEELMAEIRSDAPFYRRSGGGVTLGGGEVLLWAHFAVQILALCKAEHVNTVVETCGHGEWSSLESLVPYVDLFYFDVKHIDQQAHERLTGVTNEQILVNLTRLAACGATITVRIPIIPGLTDDAENVRAIARFVRAGNLAQKIELLPYHRLGEEKYDRLGVGYELKGLTPPGNETMNRLAAIVEHEGLVCQVGG